LAVAIFGTALLGGSLTAQDEAVACYETVAEIRMCLPDQWTDARGLFHGVAAKDGFAYVVSQADLLYVFDLRTLPDDEQELAWIDQPAAEIALRDGNCNGILRDGDRLYVYGWSGGQIFDVRDPASPIEIGRFRASDEHIAHLTKSGEFLIAACHDRVVVYSEALMPEYPILAYTLAMEPRVQATTVSVVGDRLCVSGSKQRSSGVSEYWLGVWDVADFTRPTLLEMTSAKRCGCHLISRDGSLLRVAGGGAELWEVNGTGAALLDCEPSLGTAFAMDGDVVVFDGGALLVGDGQLEGLCTFDARPDAFYDAYPSVGVSTEDLVLLPRPRSILVLHREDGA